MMRVRVLSVLAIAKICMSLYIAQVSEFVPDEYWQSTEVAYKALYNRGHWTWEWYEGIRSVMCPAIILLLYRFGNLFGLGSFHYFMTFGPQLIQAVLTYIGYQCFFQFTTARMGRRVAEWANFILIMDWFTTFCGARLISNQTEFSLNCVALMYLQKGFLTSLVCVLAINFYLRPTAVIFWIPFAFEIFDLILKSHFVQTIYCAVLSAKILGLGAIVDKFIYKRSVVSWWEFFVFNVVKRGSAEFGVNHTLWYIFSGIPSILGPLSIFLPMGLTVGHKAKRLTIYFMIYVAIYSMIDHKEIRFLLPGLPIVFTVLGSVVAKMTEINGERSNSGSTNRKWTFALFRLYVVLNIVAVLFFGLAHQIGIKPASSFLRTNMRKLDIVETPRVWFLMPCYSVPVYTYMNHPTAEFVHYICTPKEFRNFYAKDDSKGVILQTNGLSNADLRRDIHMKAHMMRLPHFIMTYDKHVATIVDAFQEINATYNACYHHDHTYIGDFPRGVYVLCRDSVFKYISKL